MAHMLYRRSDRVSSHLGPDNSDAYYEAVTDLMFSLSLIDREAPSRMRACSVLHLVPLPLRCTAALIGVGGRRVDAGKKIFSGNLKSIDRR